MKYQFLLKSYLILRKKISLNKGKPENSFTIVKSKTHMEQSMGSNFFKKFKVIAFTAQTSPIFQITFFKKKMFLRNSSKPGHGNLVLITSTVQAELSKLIFNFDDIRTYFLQILRDCRQITFVMLNRFCPLSKKNTPFSYQTISRGIEYILIKIYYVVFQVLKILLTKICKIQSLDLLFLVVFVSFYIKCF